MRRRALLARRYPLGRGGMGMGLGDFGGPHHASLFRQPGLYAAYADDDYDPPYHPGDDDVGASYEELLALDENIVQPSLTSYQLEAYTTTQRITAEQSKRLDACVICMDTYEDGDEARRLPCLCLFHRRCIDRHLEGSVTCPICRTDVRDGNGGSHG